MVGDETTIETIEQISTSSSSQDEPTEMDVDEEQIASESDWSSYEEYTTGSDEDDKVTQNTRG